MYFRNFAERALGSKTKVKVLLYLLAEGAPTSEREIAELLGISHTSVNKVMKNFHDLNLITPLRVGNVNLWRLNEGSYSYRYLNSLRTITMAPPLKDLQESIKDRLNPYAKEIIIFGSIAEKRESPDSDIDLFVLLKDARQKKFLLERLAKLGENCLRSYGNRLSPVIMTEKETKLAKNKKLMENIKKGTGVLK